MGQVANADGIDPNQLYNDEAIKIEFEDFNNNSATKLNQPETPDQDDEDSQSASELSSMPNEEK